MDITERHTGKRRVFDIIQLGTQYDAISRGFDYVLVSAIIINLLILIIDTFDPAMPFRPFYKTVEYITVVFFVVEYILRIWTAEYLYPDETNWPLLTYKKNLTSVLRSGRSADHPAVPASGFFALWLCCVPGAASVPRECAVRRVQCRGGRAAQQKGAVVFFDLYDPHYDAGVLDLYVFPRTRRAAGGFSERLFRDMVVGVHPAYGRLWGYLPDHAGWRL